MENKITADQAFRIWHKAVKEGQPKEATDALFAEYMRVDKIEKGNAGQPVRIETSYRRNGRPFRVAVYANGTTADID